MGIRQCGIMVVKGNTEVRRDKKLCSETCNSSDGNESCTGADYNDTETGTGATPREQGSQQKASFTDTTTAVIRK